MKSPRIPWMLALAASVSTIAAQPPQGRMDRRPPQVPPIFAALDTDHDLVLSAEEIESASGILGALDKNGDGEITLAEFHLPPPNGRKPRKDDRDPDASPPNRPMVPPVIAALDTDEDGQVSESEIAAASESLKELDRNGDGVLSREELRPQGPPSGPRPDGPPPGGGAEIE